VPTIFLSLKNSNIYADKYSFAPVEIPCPDKVLGSVCEADRGIAVPQGIEESPNSDGQQAG
jgi:hypothetical protein